MLLTDQKAKLRNGRCCGSLDLGDARRVAQQLGIPHYTLRLDAEFERLVIDAFVDDYAAGRTPSPCVRCNTFIKFDAFVERARRLGAERIATGHYARIVEGPDGFELHRAADEQKDQSYFLFELDSQKLGAALFPLGELTKSEVREEARRLELVVAEKGESMEICFVDDALETFLEPRLARRVETGAAVMDRDGNPLGTAGPYYRYTVGQRRGLGLGGPRSAGQNRDKLYVLEIQAAQNRVIAGTREQLRSDGLRGERLHWIGPPPAGEIEATVRIRSRHPGVKSLIRSLPGRHASVEFESPQEAVAPGQAAVFYDGSRVLGGCWITGPERR
jgi:tRNA-specific 2-thiouridylase